MTQEQIIELLNEYERAHYNEANKCIPFSEAYSTFMYVGYILQEIQSKIKTEERIGG